jgi:RNA polymerase sigma-70 factor (ECF subfamily)
MSVMLPQRPFERRSLEVAALYAKYAALVRRVLHTRGVSRGSLDDAVQDVFLVAVRRFDDFVPSASHKTWLFAVAVNVARDYRRRIKRKGGLSSLRESHVASVHADPFAATAAAQSLEAIDRGLRRLAHERREVFILAALEQLTGPEIAERLSLNLNTVYSRLNAARRELCLDEYSAY